jgi:hypothetical protein
MTQKPFLPQPDDEVIDILEDILEGEHEDAEELLISPDPLVLTTTQQHPVADLCVHCGLHREHCTCLDQIPAAGADGKTVSDLIHGQVSEGHKAPRGRSDRTTDRQYSPKLPRCPICKHTSLPMIVVEDHPVLSVVFGAPKVCTLCFGEAMGAARGMLTAIRKRK